MTGMRPTSLLLGVGVSACQLSLSSAARLPTTMMQRGSDISVRCGSALRGTLTRASAPAGLRPGYRCCDMGRQARDAPVAKVKSEPIPGLVKGAGKLI
jgi:hypothetical protein